MANNDADATPVLGGKVRRMREDRRLSRIALARLSAVSARTIAQLEQTGVARFDAIVRVAQAFQQSPQDWLGLAGLDTSDQQIEKIIARQRALRATQAFQPLKPEEYFDHLDGLITEKTPAMICISIMTQMSLRGEEIRARTKQLLDHGLRIAILVPYPVNIAALRAEPVLLGFYAQAFGNAVSLARELRDLNPKLSDRVRIFKLRSEAAMVVQPPALLNELRPCIIRFFDKDLQPSRHELSFYVRFTDGRPDRWIRVNRDISAGEEGARAEESFNLWRSYFTEVLDAWNITRAGDEVTSGVNWVEHR